MNINLPYILRSGTKYYVTLQSICHLYSLEFKDAIIKLSDVQLLEHICTSGDDQFHYEQFIKRYLGEIQANCDRICTRRKLDKHIGQQIAHETFERVRKYKSYTREGSKIQDDKKAILSYLKRISTHLFNDYYNLEKKKYIHHKSYFDEISLATSQNVDIKALLNKKETALFIFSKLNKKEQAVVLKDIEFKKHQKYLPDDVTASLAKELKVKPDTIRKIRARAIEKIKNAINEVNKK